MVIISPSAKGLQRLVDICAVYGQIHDILFNQDKTVCMYMPSGNHYYLNTPVVILNGIQLAFVRTYKYLGTVMTCDNADDANMRRQRGICGGREGGREGREGREGGREGRGGMEGGMEDGREGGRGGRDGGRYGGRGDGGRGGREGREGWRAVWRERGREGGREVGREGWREGREGGRDGGR